MHPLQICHGCGHCQPPPHNGPVACLIDGIDIVKHFKTHYCPKGKFDGAEAYRPALPAIATPEVIAVRRAVCDACPHNQRITEKMGVVLVKCAKCTKCEGGRSLTAAGQTCPIGKW